MSDREVSETEAFLRRLAEELADYNDDRIANAILLDLAADEYAALENDLAVALEVLRERTAERDALEHVALAALPAEVVDLIKSDARGVPR